MSRASFDQSAHPHVPGMMIVGLHWQKAFCDPAEKPCNFWNGMTAEAARKFFNTVNDRFEVLNIVHSGEELKAFGHGRIEDRELDGVQYAKLWPGPPPSGEKVLYAAYDDAFISPVMPSENQKTLGDYLEDKNITTLIFSGCNSGKCLLETVQTAASYVSRSTPGWTLDELKRIWEGKSPGRERPQVFKTAIMVDLASDNGNYYPKAGFMEKSFENLQYLAQRYNTRLIRSADVHRLDPRTENKTLDDLALGIDDARKEFLKAMDRNARTQPGYAARYAAALKQ